MTFWQILVRVLPRAPLRALEALWWHVTRRRVRAMNILRGIAAPLPFWYEHWIRNVAPPSGADQKTIVAQWAWRPIFCVVLVGGGGGTEEGVRRSAASLLGQAYGEWKLLLPQSAGAAHLAQGDGRIQIVAEPGLPAAIEEASGDFLLPLREGDELAAGALFRLAAAAQAEPEAAIIYGDHDEIDQSGRRRRPWFKPRWNEEMFLAQDYLTGSAAVALAEAKAMPLGDQATADELMLLVARGTRKPIVHVPHIVVHTRPGACGEASSKRQAMLRRHLAGTGAEISAGPFGTVKVSWPLPAELPLVSIIVPTKDKLELLRPCVDGLLGATTYRPFELLIVDNASVEPRTARYLREVAADPRVRVLAYPGPYNFSAINNYAVRETRGTFLCLLNNDTQVVSGDWLTELMRYAVRPEVGAVGAKLLYEDGTIQHAGVVIGMGDAAGHAHRFLADTQPGYFRYPHVAQFVTAVTGACLLVEKRKYVAVGGLDEQCLAIAYNDIDLCLKLEQAGWRNVYVPHAPLIHHETKSRGKDDSPSQVERYRRELRIFQERWGTRTYKDPLFNPNLDPASETYTVRLQ